MPAVSAEPQRRPPYSSSRMRALERGPSASAARHSRSASAVLSPTVPELSGSMIGRPSVSAGLVNASGRGSSLVLRYRYLYQDETAATRRAMLASAAGRPSPRTPWARW